MTDLAFFRLPDGKAWLGLGPFTESAEMPEGAAFYWNDFKLSSAAPWHVPATLLEVQSAADLAGYIDASESLRILWEKPPTEGFKMAFRRIRREILSGKLTKMVPVLTERGKIIEGAASSLLLAAYGAPNNLWGYGRWEQASGFLGASPELLFRRNGGEVHTMALAGTAKPGNDEAFLADIKEIEEHEIVAEFLVDRLKDLGPVERSERTLCATAGLRHFQSHIRVQCSQPPDANHLVHLLHPTPAVGCLPRTDEWLARLHEYRELLRVPSFFGAPFGFSDGHTQHMIVSIRGLTWTGQDIVLPSGCGIVGGSAFDHEWRELRLKREAVAHLLALS